MDQWHYYTDRWGIFSKIDFMQLIIVGAGSLEEKFILGC